VVVGEEEMESEKEGGGGELTGRERKPWRRKKAWCGKNI
jgi:hypothetical protein